jgi:hypothetical protein
MITIHLSTYRFFYYSTAAASPAQLEYNSVPYDTDLSNTSHLGYLDKEYLNDTKEKEIWTRPNNKQQQYNTHTIERRKKCNYPNRSMANRTYRMWSLLVKHFEHALHNVPWMWKYNNPTNPSNIIQRGTTMSASCWHCGNPIVFDDNILSKNGRPKPLNDWNHEVHNCKFSPFNKARESASERKALGKIEEWKVIDELRDQVTATNNRLWNYELELVVRYKED